MEKVQKPRNSVCIICIVACLPIPSLETGYSIVARLLVSAGTCLPNLCLAMNYSDFQASCHSMLQKEPFRWTPKDVPATTTFPSINVSDDRKDRHNVTFEALADIRQSS
jgi:hypothetical protein